MLVSINIHRWPKLIWCSVECYSGGQQRSIKQLNLSAMNSGNPFALASTACFSLSAAPSPTSICPTSIGSLWSERSLHPPNYPGPSDELLGEEKEDRQEAAKRQGEVIKLLTLGTTSNHEPLYPRAAGHNSQ